jgi:hypothetical protein
MRERGKQDNKVSTIGIAPLMDDSHITGPGLEVLKVNSQITAIGV